ncbi:MAG: sigma-70 family RNA polymerase sigma factor [Planctomycetota bacterium]|jgi:RNA polymerase sigma-70 factor (ECF subfamily)
MDTRPTHSAESLLVHGPFLKGLARSLLRDDASADDLVQDTYRVAMESPPRKAGNLRGWLATVARNLARERGRREPRMRGWEAAAARREALPSTAEIAEREATRRDVVEAVLSLDKPYRDVILLRFYEDLAPRHIARELKLPVETVRTRVRRGLARLRAELDARHGGDRASWALLVAPLAFPRRAAASAFTTPTAGKAVLVSAATVALVVSAWWWFGSDDSPTHRGEAPAVVAVDPDARNDADTGDGSLSASMAGDDLDDGVAARGAVEALVPENAEPPFLAGIVRRAEGGPDTAGVAAGVEVFAAGLLLDDWSVLLDASGAADELLHAIARRTSDEQGRFVVDGLPRGAWFVGTSAGNDVPFEIAALVLVDAPPAVVASVTAGVGLRCRQRGVPEVPVHALDLDGTLEVAVQAASAMPLAVTVRDTDGRAIPGADVLHTRPDALVLAEAVVSRDRALEILGPMSARSTADETGRALVAGAGRAGELLVRAEGFEPAQIDLGETDAGDSGDVEVALRPGLRLVVAGRLVDQDGAPVANASVWLTSDVPTFLENDALRARFEEDHRPSTVTGADGRFAFPVVDRLSDSTWEPDVLVADRWVVVCALVDGARPAMSSVRPRRDERPQHVDLSLVAGGPLVGRLLDADTGEMIQAEVTVTPEGRGDHTYFMFEPEEFWLGDIPFGPLTVTLRKLGHEPVVVRRDWRGEELELPVRFEPVAWTLDVALVDRDGAPLGNDVPVEFEIPGSPILTGESIRVRAYASDPSALLMLPADHPAAGSWPPGTWGANHIDDAFRFHFEGEPPQDVWLAVVAAGDVLGVQRVTRGTPELTMSVDVSGVARRLALLSVEAVDRATGRAVRPGMVSLYRPGSLGVSDALTTFLDEAVCGIVDRPGTYDVRVRANGYASELLRDVEIGSGETVELTVELDPAAVLDLRLERAGSAADTTGDGQVVREDVAGQVRVFDVDGRQVMLSALGATHELSLTGLGAGLHFVRATTADRVGSAWVELVAGETTELVLTLSQAASLRVRLDGPAAETLRGGKLVILDGEGRRLAQQDLDATDAAELSGPGRVFAIEPGATRVMLSAPGTGVIERTLVVPGAGETEVVLD